jgi:hypothetical protein
MIPNELIEYYESLVRSQDPSSAEENRHLRAYVTDLRDIYGNNESYSGNCDTELACWSAAVKWTAWRVQHPNAWRANTRRVLITQIVAIFAFPKRGSG